MKYSQMRSQFYGKRSSDSLIGKHEIISILLKWRKKNYLISMKGKLIFTIPFHFTLKYFLCFLCENKRIGAETMEKIKMSNEKDKTGVRKIDLVIR